MTGPEFKAHRLELGMTQQQIADAMKLKSGNTQISRWENGAVGIPGAAQVLIVLMVKHWGEI